MNDKNLTTMAEAFGFQLMLEEKSRSTRNQYHRDVSGFVSWIQERPLTKQETIHYKEVLAQRYQPSSINTKIAALNGFFRFIGREDVKIKQLRIQRRPYSARDRELTKAEYMRLVDAAEKRKNNKLSLLVQTICGTGIRVSELSYITVEALNQGEATIRLKGKTRVILLSGKIRNRLLKHAKKAGIKTGPVFVTRSGTPMNRSNIWKMMKSLCVEADVESGKVFPHNLRKLFARTFYKMDKDIAKLADVLGHSSIDTTRIYLMSSGQEHCRKIEALGLVV